MSNSNSDNRRRRAARKQWLRGAAAGLGMVTGGATYADLIGPRHDVSVFAQPYAASDCSIHRLDALGTSMDIILQAPQRDVAALCEQQILAEIERLSAILSTYDTTSDICGVMRGVVEPSPELSKVFELYRLWNERTGGAIHLNMAAVKELWRAAARTGKIPAESSLHSAFNMARAFNVDALGKAFIIEHVVEVARRIVPAGLLDIGGDIRVWGDRSWWIDVADPRNPADNAPPMTGFHLRESAVATSGGYARYDTIAGRRYSHIIDPRTLHPVPIQRAATFVASDCVTANALSTAACVLDVQDAVALADAYGASYLVSDVSGDRRGGSLATNPTGLNGSHSRPASAPAQSRPSSDANTRQWPDGYQVAIEIAYKSMPGKYKRPYVAVWIENEKGKVVRDLSVWGTKPKYLPELTAWWKAIDHDREKARSVTRATRPPGSYTLTWDGRDDVGRAVPKGTYVVWIEVNREHGRHTRQPITVVCGDTPRSVIVPASAESNESKIEYGRRPEQ